MRVAQFERSLDGPNRVDQLHLWLIFFGADRRYAFTSFVFGPGFAFSRLGWHLYLAIFIPFPSPASLEPTRLMKAQRAASTRLARELQNDLEKLDVRVAYQPAAHERDHLVRPVPGSPFAARIKPVSVARDVGPGDVEHAQHCTAKNGFFGRWSKEIPGALCV